MFYNFISLKFDLVVNVLLLSNFFADFMNLEL